LFAVRYDFVYLSLATMNRLEVFKQLDLTKFKDSENKDREVVGIWDKSGCVELVENVSDKPHTFALNLGTRRRIASDEVMGIIHTHLPGDDVDLSHLDIRMADSYAVDIASHLVGTDLCDYYSPYLHHPYPLFADLSTFEDRRYEEYRSDCYKFIENIFCFIGYPLPLIKRSPWMFAYDSDFALSKLTDISGWQPRVGDDVVTGDLLILKFDTESHHFGLMLKDKVVTFTSKGIRLFSLKFAEKYTTRVYRREDTGYSFAIRCGLKEFESNILPLF
jgi:hypothetical protein